MRFNRVSEQILLSLGLFIISILFLQGAFLHAQAPLQPPPFAWPADPRNAANTVKELSDEINSILEEAVRSGELDEKKAFEIRKKLDIMTGFFLSKKPELSNILRQVARDIYIELSPQNTRTGSPESERLLSSFEKLSGLMGIYDGTQGLQDEALKSKLNMITGTMKSLGYLNARKAMFKDIDNHDGKVRCVYTGRYVECNDIPSPEPPQAMNTEHTWPKSLGAANEPAKCDLHHLYPTDTFANATRGSYPFGEVKSPVWEQGGSSFDGEVFEPRDDHKGNVARAYFYFSVRYRLPIPQSQEEVLRKWHKLDPVNAEDRARNEKICQYQSNRNPFVDCPEFVDRISDF